MSDHLATPDTAADQDLAWVLPGYQAPPTQALARIRQICEHPGTDLHGAMFTVLATHQAVPRDILAIAIKQFRRDCDGLSKEDVVGLLNALWNGGQQGFNSVLRTRKGGDRKPASLSWLKPDD